MKYGVDWRAFAALALLVVGGLWSCTVVEVSAPTEAPTPDQSAPPQEIAAYHLVEDGRQQLAEGRTDAAIATFQKALALAPSSPHANAALAEAKVRQGQFRAAVVYADRVVRLMGDHPDWRWRAALIRAKAFEGLGDVTGATEEYRRVLGDQPSNPEARAGLARLESDGRLQ